MGEIGGSVQWVYVPTVVGVSIAASALLGNNAVAGKALSKTLRDQRFGAAVRLRDHIHGALVGNLVRTLEPLIEDCARLTGDFNRSVQEILHVFCGGLWSPVQKFSVTAEARGRRDRSWVGS